MKAKINIIYTIAENTLNADEIDRLISELQTLKDIKERDAIRKNPSSNPFLAEFYGI
ncbi:MAG: hypothetical protein U0518_04620 [Candidatus Gracilibacteria bacterium]